MDFDGDGYNDLIIPFQNAATGYWNQVVFYVVKGSDVVDGRGSISTFAVNLCLQPLMLTATVRMTSCVWNNVKRTITIHAL